VDPAFLSDMWCCPRVGHVQEQVHRLAEKHGTAISFAFILAVLSPGIFLINLKLGYQAQLVRRMRGKDLPPQNDWDFGQIAALMIWLLVA